MSNPSPVLGEKLVADLHATLPAQTKRDVVRKIFLAAASPRGAWLWLGQGVREALGGPAIELAREEVLRRIEAIKDKAPEAATLRTLRRTVLRRRARQARLQECTHPERENLDKVRTRSGSTLEALEKRLASEEELTNRRFFAREAEAHGLWANERVRQAADGPCPLDGPAHMIALRIVAGREGLPGSLLDLQGLIEADAGPSDEQLRWTARVLTALREADTIARECSDLTTRQLVMGTSWTPDARSARYERHHDLLEWVQAAPRTPRERALITTGIVSLELLQAATCITREVTSFQPPPLDLRTVGIQLRSGVHTAAVRALSVRHVPGTALPLLRHLRELALLEPTREGRRRRAPPPGVELVDAEPRHATGLYLAGNGRDIEVGSKRLRFPVPGPAGTKPVTRRNAEGNLLLWLARGRKGPCPRVRPEVRTHLRRALDPDDIPLKIVGTGPDLRLEPRPGHIDRRLP